MTDWKDKVPEGWTVVPIHTKPPNELTDEQKADAEYIARAFGLPHDSELAEKGRAAWEKSRDRTKLNGESARLE